MIRKLASLLLLLLLVSISPAQTFNSVVEVDASGANGSSTETLPTADAVLALAYHYEGDVGDTLSTVTINGVSMTSVVSLADGANGSHAGCDAFFLDTPAAGPQSVAWTWGNGTARTNGGGIILFFLDEDASTISVVDSAVDGHASNQVSGTVDSTTDDLVVALSATYDANAAVDSFGTLRTSDPIEIGPVGLFARGYTGAGSAVSTTIDQTGESFGCLVVVSLEEAGGGSIIPQIIHHREQQDQD